VRETVRPPYIPLNGQWLFLKRRQKHYFLHKEIKAMGLANKIKNTEKRGNVRHNCEGIIEVKTSKTSSSEPSNSLPGT